MMHTLHLGIMLVFARKVLWLLVLAGVWARGQTLDDQVAMSIMALRHFLPKWRTKYLKDHPRESLTKVRLSKKVMGEVAEKALRTKAGETWTILLFLESVLGLHHAKLGNDGRRLLKACSALTAFVKLLNAAPAVLSPETILSAWDRWKRHVSLTDVYDDLEIPKRHLFFHCVVRSAFFGNPRIYATWFDEALNKDLKAACRMISQQTFEPNLLLRFPIILKKVGRNKKREDEDMCTQTANTNESSTMFVL